MGEGGHEEDGGVGDEGLEDAMVPAGDEAKNEAREEDGGQCWQYAIYMLWSERGQQRKPFPKKRDKAGSKDEKEPSNNKKVKDIN